MMTAAVQQAADWCARLHAEDCSEDDRVAFQSWIERDAHHCDVYAHVMGIWGASHTFTQPAVRRYPMTRRMALGAGLSAVGALALSSRPADAMIIRTGRGESRALRCEGAALLLDACSAVILPARRHGRNVRLVQGRLGIDVKARETWFFEASQCAFQVSSGRFDVQIDQRELAATVLKGTMTVHRRNASSLVLTQGERLILHPDGHASRDRPRLFDLSAWRNGRAVFRDTPLQKAVREMNRYSARQIKIVSPDLQAERISGIFHTAHVDRFVQELDRVLPVTIEKGATIRIMKVR